MKTNGVIFIIAFLLAFGGGYLYFSQGGKDQKQQTTQQGASTETGKEQVEKEEVATVPAEAEVMSNNSCLSCHAVSSMGVEGGTTGPDLSNAYKDIEGKHGKDLDSFLQEPTSAVMSGVIGGSPLSEEDRAEIVKFLEKASEQ
ncbi:MAG TPA: c-type cytochrome [Sporosarcina sp.]|nr:c-type cytochrome [Sporosarcina sp.]